MFKPHKILFYFFILNTLFAEAKVLTNAALHKKPTLAEMKLANFTQLTGNFKQKKYLKDLSVEIKTDGHFQVFKQNSENSVFKWNIENPKVSNICIDGVGIVIDSGKDDPVQRKNLKFAEVGKEAGDQIANLLKILTLDQNQITKEFNIEKRDKHFILTPQAPESAFFESVTLEINKQGLAKNVWIKEKSQDEIQIEFSELNPQNTPLKKEIKCIR